MGHIKYAQALSKTSGFDFAVHNKTLISYFYSYAPISKSTPSSPIPSFSFSHSPNVISVLPFPFLTLVPIFISPFSVSPPPSSVSHPHPCYEIYIPPFSVPIFMTHFLLPHSFFSHPSFLIFIHLSFKLFILCIFPCQSSSILRAVSV